MGQTCNYLFVYGTLLDLESEFTDYISNNCRFYGKGKLKGRLYDAGEYPGAVADESHSGYVYGSIFVLNDFVETLKYIDNYEGYGIEQEQPNLFMREIIRIDTDAVSLDCWVYLYNLPTDDLILIEGGDYLRYKDNER
jgi:gamma-glutamylcyclotransferase (GGCT)/AIG2-like uncharacterized protein YtfP